MHKAIGRIRDMLTEYKAASEISDFVNKAQSVLSEFRMYGVTPEKLDKTADMLGNTNLTLSSKLRDLSLIFSSYSSVLDEVYGEGFNYRDATDDLERLATVLCDTKFFTGKTVIIDSFYGFKFRKYL